MPRALPSQVVRFIASVAVIVLLTAHPAAAAPQKPTPPAPSSQTKLEDRVKDLETRLTAAEQKAEKATMEKEYILRTQNHYESYYKEVFSTQTHILWTIGITVTLLSITLSVVFFVAGRFGFNIFDRKIDSALKDATTQLRTEFTERLAKEANLVREASATQLKALEDGLTERITVQETDLKTRSQFQYMFAQGMATAVEDRHADARRMYRRALQAYKLGKPRKVIPRGSAVTTVKNIFTNLQNQDEANFLENAKRELADKLYNDLEEELAFAAINFTELAPLIAERKSTPRQPIDPQTKTGEAEPIEFPPAAPARDDE